MLVKDVADIWGEGGILDVTALSGLCKRPELCETRAGARVGSGQG